MAWAPLCSAARHHRRWYTRACAFAARIALHERLYLPINNIMFYTAATATARGVCVCVRFVCVRVCMLVASRGASHASPFWPRLRGFRCHGVFFPRHRLLRDGRARRLGRDATQRVQSACANAMTAAGAPAQRRLRRLALIVCGRGAGRRRGMGCGAVAFGSWMCGRVLIKRCARHNCFVCVCMSECNWFR